MSKLRRMLPKFFERMTEPFRPLPECVTIKESPLSKKTNRRELGMFATEDIKRGRVLGISHVYHELFKDNFIRTSLGGFINHSDKPNVEAVRDGDFRYIKVIRDVLRGEEITLKYNLYNLEKVAKTSPKEGKANIDFRNRFFSFSQRLKF